MSDPLDVRPGEARVVRLFHLDLPPEQIRFLRDEPAALADILGVGTLDPVQADLLRLADLDDLGLSGYLTEGMGVPAAALVGDAARLDTLEGHALIVRSAAFDPGGQRLAPKPGVALIAHYGEPGPDWTATAPIRTQSAKASPNPAPRPSPRAARARARRIGGGVFAVVMLALALLLWALLT